jgi:uncharacterized protein (TIGR03382 family)
MGSFPPIPVRRCRRSHRIARNEVKAQRLTSLIVIALAAAACAQAGIQTNALEEALILGALTVQTCHGQVLGTPEPGGIGLACFAFFPGLAWLARRRRARAVRL